MKLHELRPAPGSRREPTRVGRGIAAGKGKTAGRGQKGQFARTPHLPRGFEGGQMPLAQRLPKLRGFHNRFRTEYAVVNLGKLNRFEAGSVVGPDELRSRGVVARTRQPIKLLAAGRLDAAITVRVHRASKAARAAVEAAGGTVELLEPQPQPSIAGTAPSPEAPAAAETGADS